MIFELPGGAVGRVLDLVHRVDEAAVSSEAVHVTSRDRHCTHPFLPSRPEGDLEWSFRFGIRHLGSI